MMLKSSSILVDFIDYKRLFSTFIGRFGDIVSQSIRFLVGLSESLDLLEVVPEYFDLAGFSLDADRENESEG